MREDTKTGLITFLFVICFFGLLTFTCVGLANEVDKKEKACARQGGTYLRGEGVCIEMKQIPLN